MQLVSSGLIHYYIGNSRKLHAVSQAASLVGGLMLWDCKRVGLKGIMIYARYVDARPLTTSILNNKCYTFAISQTPLNARLIAAAPNANKYFMCSTNDESTNPFFCLFLQRSFPFA